MQICNLYLYHRRQLLPAEPNATVHSPCNSAFILQAACRAQEQLAKLADHKDNHVFKDLASLADSAVDRSSAANLTKAICQVCQKLR